MKPNGLCSSMKGKRAVFSTALSSQDDPISYYNTVHWGIPNGLFGAYKRSMKPNSLFNLSKRAFKPNGLFAVSKKDVTTEADLNEDLYDYYYDTDEDNEDVYLDESEDYDDEFEIEEPEKKDGQNFWATRGKKDDNNFWATRGKKSGDFWAVRG